MNSAPRSRRVVRHVRWIAVVAVSLGSIGGPVTPARAQDSAARAELRGHVLLAGDTVVLPGALIEVVGTPLRAIARKDGSYRLAGLTLGRHEVRVRLIGLSSRTVVLDIDAPGIRLHDFTLSRLPNALTEVRINGKMTRVPPRFDDVYRRMQSQWGTFFTREDIQQRNPYDLRTLLSEVPTVRVSDQGISFAKCAQGGAYLMPSQGGEKSSVQIYIDGFRVTRSGTAQEQRDVLQRVRPSEVQAIEVYTGVARIPVEFLEDACAVIAIWTR